MGTYNGTTHDGRWYINEEAASDLDGTRVHEALMATVPFNDPAVGYAGLTGGPRKFRVFFTVEPTQDTKGDLDAYFADPVYVQANPTLQEQYAALPDDPARIAFIAAYLGMT